VDLRNGVLKHKEAFLNTFAENLYAYGLGRIPDYRDFPEIRTVVSRAESRDNRFSEYVLGIVESAAFTRRSLPAVAPSKHPAKPAASTLKADAGRPDTLLKPSLTAAQGGSR